MSSVCDVCGKKPIFGMKLSHSHRRTKRRWNPNMQRVRAIVNGSPKRVQRVHLLPQGRQGRQALMRARAHAGHDQDVRSRHREGIVVRDTDREEFVLASDALEGSIFRMLRQGQRVVFDLDGEGRATHVRTGSEPDMGLPTAEI